MRAEIPRSEVVAFVESLGVDHRDVRSVQIEPEAVTITEYRRSDEGHLVARGDFVATVVTEIAIGGG